MLKRVFSICVGVLLLGFVQGASAAPAVKLRNISITTQNGHTIFEAEVTSAIGFGATTETNPNRITIELPEVEFDLPAGAGQSASGLVTGFRYGQSEEGRSRIVLDSSEPLVISWSTVKTAPDGVAARLQIDLIPATPPGIDQSISQDTAKSDPIVTATVEPAAVPPPPPRKFIIALDAGHGGIDSGAIGPDGVKEKEVAFNFTNELKATLGRTGRYDVLLTRSDDTLLPLHERVKVARNGKADLFIAIHADKFGDPNVRGTTVYTLADKATDSSAAALAQAENHADTVAGVDLGKQSESVANFLLDLAQRETKIEATVFAKKTVSALKQVTGLTPKPIKSAAFAVLKAPDIPSVLVELGYLSNRKDEALLTSPEWQKSVAEAMAGAVDAYFGTAPQASLQ